MTINYVISYADTDAAGVLHHARYLEIAERGYLAWARQRGFSFQEWSRDHNVTLVVCSVNARYRAAAKFEEEIQVVTRLQAVDRKGLDWKTLIMKDDQVLFSMLTGMACVDGTTKTIISVPDAFVAMLAGQVQPAKPMKRHLAATRVGNGAAVR
jgi:acyl-CoA thioester hydrolase